MQVTTPTKQHAVMIEAVENHMPEVIVIDEIGTELEAQAARTIAERGVQLVGTAHGNVLENLVINPTLADLIGGIQSVTLGDEEAKRRGTQKSILERKSPPTFDIVVEIQDRDRVAIHPDVSEAVDALLRNQPTTTEIRRLDENGEVIIEKATPLVQVKNRQYARDKIIKAFLFGVNRIRMEQVATESQLNLDIVDSLNNADIFITARHYFRRKPQKVKDAQSANLPISVQRSNTPAQIRQLLYAIYPLDTQPDTDRLSLALDEAEQAISKVKNGETSVELSSQSAYIRRLQHLIAERNELASHSTGKGHDRRVIISK